MSPSFSSCDNRRYCPTLYVRDINYNNAEFSPACVEVQNGMLLLQLLISSSIYLAFLILNSLCAGTCSAGYHISNSGECLPCPQGFYSSSANSADCSICPPGTSSIASGSVSFCLFIFLFQFFRCFHSFYCRYNYIICLT